MKTEKLIDAVKAFKIENLTKVSGGIRWSLCGGGTNADGSSYNDWVNSDGGHACGIKDGTFPFQM
jgi:hypothetical protein